MKLQSVIIAGIMGVMLGGCTVLDEKIIPASTEPVPSQPAAGVVKQDSNSLEKRFVTPANTNADPIQTITAWAQRYEESSKQTEQLREKNNALVLENSQYEQKIQQLQNEITRIKNELEQSNSLVQQAHIELSKWKADVLGFRDEMRQAQSAQLAALSNILRILGAEPVSAPAAAGDAQPPASKEAKQ